VNVLVLPTSRPRRAAEFLEAWQPWPWDRIIIVEDAPEVSGSDSDRVVRYCWRDIDESLQRPEIISRRDSAIRAFGFWKAWQMGAACVFTLDDDCFPVGRDYVGRHLRNMEETPRWGSTVRHLRVRGLPYANVGTVPQVCVSVGLWVGHPDVDAIQALARPVQPLDAVIDRGLESWVLPSEQYFPICGMNLAVRREAVCLMYFPPMGQGSPYARFDDIWAGLVLQRICRHLRLSIVCGQPVVEHRRASDPFDNLVKEAPGVRANESMWEIVDRVRLDGGDPLTCMREMGVALRDGPAGGEYAGRWGRAIVEWCRLFDAPPQRRELATTVEQRRA
jgi:hypothetical protein